MDHDTFYALNARITQLEHENLKKDAEIAALKTRLDKIEYEKQQLDARRKYAVSHIRAQRRYHMVAADPLSTRQDDNFKDDDVEGVLVAWNSTIGSVLQSHAEKVRRIPPPLPYAPVAPSPYEVYKAPANTLQPAYPATPSPYLRSGYGNPSQPQPDYEESLPGPRYNDPDRYNQQQEELQRQQQQEPTIGPVAPYGIQYPSEATGRCRLHRLEYCPYNCPDAGYRSWNA